MTFYITPPHGRLSLSRLKSYAENRFAFLQEISKCKGKFIAMRDVVEDSKTVAASECLIEGSKKDQVSHFLLRLACCQNEEMTDFFIHSEVSLFAYRVSCMSIAELMTMVKPIKRLHNYIHREFEYTSNVSMSQEMCKVLHLLEQLTMTMSWEDLINAYIKGDDENYITLSFYHVVDLVAKRLVFVAGGYAYVPCRKLSEVLKVLFELTLRHGIAVSQRKLSGITEDSRIKKLFLHIKRLFNLNHKSLHRENKDIILCEEVDSLNHLFPPCMNHLHNSLRETHRLRHHSRVQYTLFLKELGLPVNEAVQFWSLEYSKSTSQHGIKESKVSCSHNWSKDGRRYTYSIRHLYGLEGTRTNYRGHCCTSLQSFDGGPGEQGGCPFKTFDTKHLTKMLKNQGIRSHLASDICTYADNSMYNEACTMYMYGQLQQLQINTKEKTDQQRRISLTAEVCEDINGNGKEFSKTINSSQKNGSCEHYKFGVDSRNNCSGIKIENDNVTEEHEVKYDTNSVSLRTQSCFNNHSSVHGNPSRKRCFSGYNNFSKEYEYGNLKRKKCDKKNHSSFKLTCVTNCQHLCCKSEGKTDVHEIFKEHKCISDNSAFNKKIGKHMCEYEHKKDIRLSNEENTTELIDLRDNVIKEVDSLNVLHSSSQSCYEHDHCPPSQTAKSQSIVFSQSDSVSHTVNSHINITENLNKTTENVDHMYIAINKPIDYFLTYKNLITGLTSKDKV